MIFPLKKKELGTKSQSAFLSSTDTIISPGVIIIPDKIKYLSFWSAYTLLLWENVQFPLDIWKS